MSLTTWVKAVLWALVFWLLLILIVWQLAW